MQLPLVKHKLRDCAVTHLRLAISLTCLLLCPDTAGQERFQSITSSYYRGAHGVVFCFDVTRRETFDSLENKWLPDFAEHCTRQQAVAMVVGNKVDMVSTEQQAD